MGSRIEVKTAMGPAGQGIRAGAVEVMARQRLSLRERVRSAQRAIEDAGIERLRVDVCGRRHERF